MALWKITRRYLTFYLILANEQKQVGKNWLQINFEKWIEVQKTYYLQRSKIALLKARTFYHSYREEEIHFKVTGR